MTISKVGIVGSGLMGSGIAQVVAQVGTPTVLVKATGGEVDSLRDRG
ncbi:MAG: 3-hydroxybutyryl-CoA dehydrogenase, partial [Nitrospinae bacterium]|nr:3-hydroxybutyryl-CoA dehydrogenase [Nitrospinota bacterium]